MRAEDAILGDEIFILERQSLVDEARYIRQQPHPFVVAHGEETSYAAAGGPVLRIFWPYGIPVHIGSGRVAVFLAFLPAQRVGVFSPAE